LTHSDGFAKSIGFGRWPFLLIFKNNGLIFRMLAGFRALFWIKQLECVCGDVVGRFLAILFFSILHGL